MSALRTKKVEQDYLKARQLNILQPLWTISPLYLFKYFKIIPSAYPHDKIASTHHLLIPIRKVDSWKKLKWLERREFKKLDQWLGQNYDCIKLNYSKRITIPEIVHWHLYILKDGK